MGHLTMREKVHIRKLNLLHHLKNLPRDSLGSEFYQLQAKLHLPGLIKECRTLIRMYNLPDIIDGQKNFAKEKWKKLVKIAVREVSELNAKKEFEGYSELKHMNVPSENLQLHHYICNMNLRNARLNFKIRSYMTDTKFNRKSDKKFAAELWRCDHCKSLDSQSHIVWCPAFSPLREGKDLNNDDDLVTYFQEVMRIRSSTYAD